MDGWWERGLQIRAERKKERRRDEKRPGFPVSLAGALGFEPRSTDPKSGVLPLHHAPSLLFISAAGL